MERSTAIRYKCGSGPTGSYTPCAFTIFTGRGEQEKQPSTEPVQETGAELTSGEGLRTGRWGDAQGSLRISSRALLMTQLPQAYPLKTSQGFFFFFKLPFLKRGHCVLGWGPGTLLLVCDPTGDDRPTILGRPRGQQSEPWNRVNSSKKIFLPTQCYIFLCFNYWIL